MFVHIPLVVQHPSGKGFGYQPQLFLPGQQPPFMNQNYFRSDSYSRPRSRRRRTSSSSTSREANSRRGSPLVTPRNPYVNHKSFPSMPPVPPRVASPLILPQRPVW
jgi:hypothetical protein